MDAALRSCAHRPQDQPQDQPDLLINEEEPAEDDEEAEGVDGAGLDQKKDVKRD